ncbi:GNAT family N-acetyltransferase [Brevibacillus ginsengisoli]|uniref:GNAT family N-acetyltransferase n=1 Tax=Brevibacillus ginsengisoli TaxID=363854 RepID=UPI003CF6BB83
MSFTLRHIHLPEDYNQLAMLLNSIQPDSVSVEQLQEQDLPVPTDSSLYMDEAGQLNGYGRERVVVQNAEGTIIGYGKAWRTPWTSPGSVCSLFCVHPDFRNQGIGETILAHLENWAKSVGSTLLLSELKDWIPASLPFVQNRGYLLDAHVVDLALDVTRFDQTKWKHIVIQLQESGIKFLTLADEPTEESERKLYQLYKDTLVDNPGFVGDLPDIDEWRKQALPSERTRPDLTFIAADGDQFVGVTTLFTTDASDVLYTNYTGVRKDYRGRRLALALKIRSIEAAKESGATRMLTETEAENFSMQAVNNKLGYEVGKGTYRIMKQL